MDKEPHDIYNGVEIVPFYGQNAHTGRSVLPWGRSVKELIIILCVAMVKAVTTGVSHCWKMKQ
jgi:hypothetical protein